MSQSVASEVVSAMVGGIFSASALYPLEVLKTRMQAETKVAAAPPPPPPPRRKTKGEEDSSSEEDVVPRPPPHNDDKRLRKEEKNDDANRSNDDDEEEKKKAEEAEAEAEELKRKYAHAASRGMTSYATLMYENEGGISPFYSGVLTSAIQSATEKALYFFAYTFYKNGYVGLSGNPDIGALSNLILGCMAEWSHLPVTLPIDCLTTAIQTDAKNRGALALLCSMLAERGAGGFYKGIEAYTVLCLKPAIQYTVYEQVKGAVLAARAAGGAARRRERGGTSGGGGADGGDDRPASSSSSSLSAAEAFFLGMFARVIATMLTYPYLRAKVMLQSTYGNNATTTIKKPTIMQMIGEQVREGGVGGLYQGIGPELTRGVFSAALMMMVKERIGVLVKAFVEKGRGGR